VNKNTLINNIKKILETQQFGVLATQGSEYPYCSLIGFASTIDCKEIVFATIRNTRKFQNISHHPMISLLIDTQSNRANDIKDAYALTALGEATEVSKEGNSNYMQSFLSKLPYLEEFVTSPNCALLAIKVNRYILVSNFQNVFEYTWGKDPL